MKATCKQCGSEYSVWSAALGFGLCDKCFKAQERERAEAEKKAHEEFQAETFFNAETKASLTHRDKPAAQPLDIIQLLTRRYSDAYTEAHTVIGIGKIIKGLGIVLGIIILIGAFVMAGNDPGHNFNGSVAGMGFALACVVSIPIYVLGILVAAQGQVQLAALDTAVNNSRHLKDDDVAQILSKKFSL